MLNFYLQLGGKFVEMIQIILITGAMMFQIQAVCWFGTELTKEVNNTL
jgi:NADH:ubiquinone oxidoreductase subunit 6 (subunit J)